MGSQMPENADEIAVAGGLCGRPLPVVKAASQDLLVPAETEIVLEGVIRCDETVVEGPFGDSSAISPMPSRCPSSRSPR
jgi:2,5-furandicarboxylate decarboxylase 1